jgi:hypothetical protein
MSETTQPAVAAPPAPPVPPGPTFTVKNMGGESKQFVVSATTVAEMAAWLGCSFKMFKHGHNDDGDSITLEDIQDGYTVFAVQDTKKVYMAVWSRWSHMLSFYPMTAEQHRLWKGHDNVNECIERYSDDEVYELYDEVQDDYGEYPEGARSIDVLPRESWCVPYSATNLRDSCVFYRVWDSDEEAFDSLQELCTFTGGDNDPTSDGWIELENFNIGPEVRRDGDFSPYQWCQPLTGCGVMVSTTTKRGDNWVLTSFPECVVESHLKNNPTLTAIKNNFPGIVPEWTHPINNLCLGTIDGEKICTDDLAGHGEDMERNIVEWIEPTDGDDE